MTVFNPTQQIAAKVFYSLISQLDGKERIGAIKALSLLSPVVEDGYLTLNEGAHCADFYVQCFDVMLSVSLSLKMLEDDGMITNATLPFVKQKKIVKILSDAEASLRRVETKLSLSPAATGTDH